MLVQANCISWLNRLRSGTVGMVLCDLPYGKTRNTWDARLPLDRLWSHWKRVCKPNAAIVLFGQGTFSFLLAASNPDWYRYTLIWEKDRPSGFLNAKRMPLRSHEDILIFYRKQPVYNPQMVDGSPSHGRGSMHGNIASKNYGKYKEQDNTKGETRKYPRSVLRFARPHPPIHPTEKPVALCEWLIRTFTDPSELVLDNCCGSGTTLVAAARTGRRFIGIDTDPEWVKVSRKRLEDTKP